MRYVIPVIALLAAPAAQAASPGQQIRDLEDAVNAAYQANDLPHYFSYYAPDLRAMYPEGPTTLPAYVKSWTDFVRKGGRIQNFTARDMHIQVSPEADAAVASYEASVRTHEPDGRVHTDRFYETDVWFQRQGSWKIVEIHYAAAPGRP